MSSMDWLWWGHDHGISKILAMALLAAMYKHFLLCHISKKILVMKDEVFKWAILVIKKV